MPDANGSPRARYRRILWFAARMLGHVWWFDIVLPHIGLRRYSERTRTERTIVLARRFRALAVALGGLMIKVGQFMSSRLDVLPPEITKELSDLQDEVPAVAFPQVRALAEAELGAPLAEVYASFDEVPVAAASLGQAHRARLRDRDAQEVGFADVIVKVQRPGIDAIVDVDLRALRRVATWLVRFRAVRTHVDAPALVEEFARTSRQEVDYLHEAAGAERFAGMFDGDERVGAPVVVWERTTRRVLTLSDVTAVKISDTEALRAAGLDPAEIALTFATVMFDQLFGQGYFHADPHPGNVFVTPVAGPDAAFRLTFVDFGMMAEVPPDTRRGLRRLLLAVASRDGRGLVEAMGEIGVLLPGADRRQLEHAMTGLFSRFGGMGFAQLRDVDPSEFRDFAGEFGEVIRTLPFQLPQDFLLVIRAVSLTSGACSGLDPEFNMWDAVEPYAAQLGREEAAGVVRETAAKLWDAAGVLLRLPGRIDTIIDELEQGRVSVDTVHLERRIGRIERLVRRALSGAVFAGLLVAGVIVFPHVAALGVVLMVASVLPLGHAMFSGRFGPGR